MCTLKPLDIFRTLFTVFWIVISNISVVPFGSATETETKFKPDNETLAYITIQELHSRIEDDTITCKEFVEFQLRRIQEFDLRTDRGAPINAFVHLNPEAIERAEQLDAYVRTHESLSGPLHCVTVAVKDVFSVAGLPLTVGSRAMIGTKAVSDAEAVAQLKKAGAIIVGTATMDELSKGFAGLSGLSGRVGNPYDPTRTAGGSSSGSAAAVAAGFTMVALGADNCGSLTLPAALSGLATIRSTRHRISTEGVFPGNRTDLVVGPIARDVKDLQKVYNLLARSSPKNGGKTAQATTVNDLDDVRIGILEEYGGEYREQSAKRTFGNGNSTLETTFDQFSSTLLNSGVTLLKNVRIPNFDFKNYRVAHGQNMDTFLNSLNGPNRDYIDLCLNEKHALPNRRSLIQCYGTYLRSVWLRGHGSNYHATAVETYESNAQHVEETLESHELDAIVLPMDPLGYAAMGNRPMHPNCSLMSRSGLPATTIRVDHGRTGPGMPIGVLVVGKRGSDMRLLDLSRQINRLFKPHPRPSLGKTRARSAVSTEFTHSWFTKQNDIRREIGKKAFDLFLRDHKMQSLTPSAFKGIVDRIVDEH